METLIRGAGWNYIPRARYHKTYVYASRRFGSKMREVYIGPVSKVDGMNKQEVLDKLAKTADKK